MNMLKAQAGICSLDKDSVDLIKKGSKTICMGIYKGSPSIRLVIVNVVNIQTGRSLSIIINLSV